MRRKIMLCAAVCFCFGIAFSVEAQRPGKRSGTAKKVSQAAQNTEAVPNQGGKEFLVKGIVADAKGPLGNKTVIVMPLDASGQPVTRQPGANATLSLDGRKPANSEKWTYYYRIIGDSRLGSMLNPRTTTNARGAFSVRVPKDLFNDPPGCVTCTGYKAGEIGLGVFTGNVSHFEIEKIKFDEKASTVDLGRVVFKPVQVILNRDLKWEKARVTTTDGTEVARFDWVTTWSAGLLPGDYIVEGGRQQVPLPRDRRRRCSR